jgi:hypothetical protein
MMRLGEGCKSVDGWFLFRGVRWVRGIDGDSLNESIFTAGAYLADTLAVIMFEMLVSAVRTVIRLLHKITNYNLVLISSDHTFSPSAQITKYQRSDCELLT